MFEEVNGFDWDSGNIKKCQKHGVSIKEIEGLFSSPEIKTAPDIKHSDAEERFLAVGMSIKNRYILVAFTFRKNQTGEMLIRPISSRYMHNKEISQYEKNFTENDK